MRLGASHTIQRVVEDQWIVCHRNLCHYNNITNIILMLSTNQKDSRLLGRSGDLLFASTSLQYPQICNFMGASVLKHSVFPRVAA